MAKHVTHTTWVIGLNFLSITWWTGVGIILMMLWLWSRREVPSLFVLLWRVVSPFMVGSPSVALVVVVWLFIYVPLWLIMMIKIKLNNIYASLDGWSNWCLIQILGAKIKHVETYNRR